MKEGILHRPMLNPSVVGQRVGQWAINTPWEYKVKELNELAMIIIENDRKHFSERDTVIEICDKWSQEYGIPIGDEDGITLSRLIYVLKPKIGGLKPR